MNPRQGIKMKEVLKNVDDDAKVVPDFGFFELTEQTLQLVIQKPGRIQS